MHIRNVCTRSPWSSWCGSHYVKESVCMCVSVSTRLCTSIRENENTQDLALTGLMKTSPQCSSTIGIGKCGYSELRSSCFRQFEVYTKYWSLEDSNTENEYKYACMYTSKPADEPLYSKNHCLQKHFHTC